ncbi:MAG: hypothetical protein GX639_02365, partial [Fibrobacter sp.]|nr:hypothetical protein [Fibrobacter sp.]
NKCRLNGLSKVNQTSYPAMQIWPQEKVHNKLKFYMYFDVNEHRNWYYSLLSGMYGWATAFERNGGSKWAPFIGTNDPNSADIDIYIADLGPIDPTIPSGLTYILPDGSRAIKSIIILNQNYENYAYLKDERLFIATHELGHALSLNHTEAGAARQIAGTPQEDIKSIMVPTFNLDETTDYESYLPLVQIPYKYEYVVPSENDIKALRILYDL